MNNTTTSISIAKLISTAHTKPLLDSALKTVMYRLHSNGCPNSALGLRVVLNLHQQPVAQSAEGLVFAAGTTAEWLLPMDQDVADYFVRHIVKRFRVEDAKAVKDYVSFHWPQRQDKASRAGLGKYYTPLSLVTLLRTMIQPMLDENPNAVVFDPAVGLAGILSAFEDHRTVAADVDATIVGALHDLGYTDVHHGNSLEGVCRKKFGIEEGVALAVVTNPPFNGSNRIEQVGGESSEFKTKDVGLSFLLASAKLQPKAICVLHPLSYLAKQSNFKQLTGLTSHYRLAKAIIVSSAEFGSALAKTPFPVIAALYVPGSMTYEDVRNFAFEIFDANSGSMLDTGKRLILANVTTTDGIINKYPPRKAAPQHSDIDLYHYNFRDANFLMNKGGLSCSRSDSAIPVQYAQLGHYAYLNCLKRRFGKNHVFGNLSPLLRPSDLLRQEFVDVCIYDTIMNNQHLSIMDRLNPESFVVTRQLIDQARIKAAAYNGSEKNPHAAFCKFWDHDGPVYAFAAFFDDYFEQLRNANLTTVVLPLTRIAGISQSSLV